MCKLERRGISNFEQTETEDIDYEKIQHILTNKISDSKMFLKQSGL